MRAGNLRNLVTFQKVTTVDDGRGGRTPTIATQFTHPAEIISVEEDEVLAGERLAAGITHVLTCRRDSQTVLIKPSWRVSWDGRIFQIDGPSRDPDGRRRELRMTLRELVSG